MLQQQKQLTTARFLRFTLNVKKMMIWNIIHFSLVLLFIYLWEISKKKQLKFNFK